MINLRYSSILGPALTGLAVLASVAACGPSNSATTQAPQTPATSAATKPDKMVRLDLDGYNHSDTVTPS